MARSYKGIVIEKREGGLPSLFKKLIQAMFTV
jgi:hypothetical protein